MARNKPMTQKAANFAPGIRLREGIFIFCTTLAVFLLIAMLTYHHADSGRVAASVLHQSLTNAGGRIGAAVAGFFFYLFGYPAFLFPLIIAYSSWLFWREGKKDAQQEPDYRLLTLRSVGFVLTLLSGCALADLHDFPNRFAIYHSGGLLGKGVISGLFPLFNFFGTTLFLFALFLSGITLLTGVSWLRLMDITGRLTLTAISRCQEIMLLMIKKIHALLRWSISHYQQRKLAAPSTQTQKKVEPKLVTPVAVMPKPVAVKPKIEPKIMAIQQSDRFMKEQQRELFETPLEGELPPLSLLDAPEKTHYKGYTTEQLESMSRAVEEKLRDFGIDVQVVAVHPGPVITRFELQLAPGIKVSRITTLAKDLARSLSVTSVRIVEVIPGKTVVGLELPNEHREIVRLNEVLASQQYDQAKSNLTIALGKDIAGHPMVVDLAKMPHLLVAGTTGSGKSVGINAMILSLLYKSTPEQVRLIMIDPKMLELSVYEGIPHLLTPVVTDMREAANALRWCVAEMERRYRLLAALGVRNLASANLKIREAEQQGQPISDPVHPLNANGEPQYLQVLPQIVIVIDEFADMMMVVGKKVEQLIARVAQKARAAGIHMLLATQRPSVDVITGLIKANIPTRIAFQVSSKIDSRTILDQQGAEQLLGNGDMLYLPPGTGVPLRVHGAFVDDHEVHKVVSDWKRRGEPQYLIEILQADHESAMNGDAANGEEGGESDPLYDEAAKIVIETRRASISSIQRRLKIGYNRAARLVEEMEKAGIVGPMENNGTREVIVPSAE